MPRTCDEKLRAAKYEIKFYDWLELHKNKAVTTPGQLAAVMGCSYRYAENMLLRLDDAELIQLKRDGNTLDIKLRWMGLEGVGR